MAAVGRWDKARHIAQAERNEHFYRDFRLAGSEYTDWAVTVLFYTCLHYVDAVLASDTTLSQYLKEPGNHRARNKAVHLCSALSPIAPLYRDLYQHSLEARYEFGKWSPVSLATIEAKEYRPIRAHIRRHLGLAA